MHLSSVNPKKTSKNLKVIETKKIIKNTKIILLKAIKSGGSSIRDFKGFLVIKVIFNKILWFIIGVVSYVKSQDVEEKLKKYIYLIVQHSIV